MTVLSDRDIAESIHYGNPGIEIEPYDESNLQPASYDLTLGDEWIVPVEAAPKDLPITLDEGLPEHSKRTYTADMFIINSMQNPDAPQSAPDGRPFVLGHVQEHINLPADITAEVKGRSSVGRLGVIPHTAGWGDPGFEGQLTLEFVNMSPNPIMLETGQRIAQVVFKRCETPARNPYGDKQNSKYQGQTGVTESRIEDDGNP